MNIEKLETTGIRLIGLFFLFTTASYISLAFSAIYHAMYYNVMGTSDQTIESVNLAAIVTQSILAILVLVLSLFAMFRPTAIQRIWRGKEFEPSETDESGLGATALIRMAALIMALHFAQKSLSEIIDIAMIANISFSGYNAAKTISNLAIMGLAIFLFLKPEVISKWK